MSINDLEFHPRVLPSGYIHRSTLLGADAHGFRGASEQTALVYTFADDWTHPLIIHVASTDGAQELFATENHDGSGVSLKGGSLKATYHDGLWAPGSGPEQRSIGEGLTIHWMRDSFHSLTVARNDLIVGVRGARTRAIRLNDLVVVTEAIPALS